MIGDSTFQSTQQDLGSAIGTALETFFRSIGQSLHLPGSEPMPVRSAQSAWSMDPATWGIGTYLLIGGVVYWLAGRGGRSYRENPRRRHHRRNVVGVTPFFNPRYFTGGYGQRRRYL